jgi:hypothetical protein
MQELYDQYEFQLNKEIDLELINLWQVTTLEGSETYQILRVLFKSTNILWNDTIFHKTALEFPQFSTVTVQLESYWTRSAIETPKGSKEPQFKSVITDNLHGLLTSDKPVTNY